MINAEQMWLEMGLRAHAAGDLKTAKSCYENVLATYPSNITANGWLGAIEAQRQNFSKARTLLERALSGGNNPDFLANYANVLQEVEEYELALKTYLKVLKKGRNATLLANLAACCNAIKKTDRALTYAEQALVIDPSYAEAWNNLGVAHRRLNNHDDALASYNKAIELKPGFAKAWKNRGNLLGYLKRYDEALASYERAISLKPDYAEAWNNRGNTLGYLKRHDEALASYERAINLKPDYAEAWNDRGNALLRLKQHQEALESYERAVKYAPKADYALGNLVYTQMKICDWRNFEERSSILRRRLLEGGLSSSPFPVLALFDDPHLQRRCSELHARNEFGFSSGLGSIAKRNPKNKIRLGYFSMDFREHPVARLLAELIEVHSRDKFEVYGFSFGPNSGDDLRRRLEGAFDRFLDVAHLSELDCARLSRELEIDIAIDLGGYTQDSRPAIFFHRAAPIQVSYLGYPGTMGMSSVDYLIADPRLINPNSESSYSEKIIYLPNSYQVNDSKRLISDKRFTRDELGLPESAFVFCCFNNNWKITPTIFETWVRILESAPNSVLWLFEDNDLAVQNLRARAKESNLETGRLVFAKRMPNAMHLSRYRLADLFLDTFPYGAHTTASDALWAGLPVLTRAGKSFASRVASSLLRSIGLPELVTESEEEYRDLAVDLANNQGKILALKERLSNNRLTCPLFDTPLYANHIELAYQSVFDRYHAGFRPEHLRLHDGNELSS